MKTDRGYNTLEGVVKNEDGGLPDYGLMNFNQARNRSGIFYTSEAARPLSGRPYLVSSS